MSTWTEYEIRARHQHGDKLDLSDISEKFRRYFHGERIKVNVGTADEPHLITGTVSVTSGWRPSLMLMRRSNAMGSSDLLSDRDIIVAVQHGRTYVPVENMYRDPNRVV